MFEINSRYRTIMDRSVLIGQSSSDNYIIIIIVVEAHVEPPVKEHFSDSTSPKTRVIDI